MYDTRIDIGIMQPAIGKQQPSNNIELNKITQNVSLFTEMLIVREIIEQQQHQQIAK